MFNAFDKNGDGFVEFAEFMLALSITSRGSVEEKLNWVFNLYDLGRASIFCRNLSH